MLTNWPAYFTLNAFGRWSKTSPKVLPSSSSSSAPVKTTIYGMFFLVRKAIKNWAYNKNDMNTAESQLDTTGNLPSISFKINGWVKQSCQSVNVTVWS